MEDEGFPLFDLPLAPRRSALFVVAPEYEDTGRTSCFQTTPAKRIGNVTISTIRRQNLAEQGSRTPLRVLGPSLSPMRPAPLKRPIDEHDEEDKENAWPKSVKHEYRFGRELYSSPVLHPLPSILKAADSKPYMDWDALDSLVRRSSPQPPQKDSPALLQSEADEIESLLFSTDAPSASELGLFGGPGDVFLGYDDFAAALETESLAGGSSVPSRRPRSASMLSLRPGPSGPSRRKIQVKIRTSTRELPALKTGSQLRKVILPGECGGTPGSAAKSRKGTNAACSSELDDPAEYTSFVSKLRADGIKWSLRLPALIVVEPVDSEESDDDFKAGEEEDEEEEETGEPVIPKWEIEGLFADTQGPLAPITHLYPSGEPLPVLEALAETCKAQVRQHYVLVVQMMALCGEVRGAEASIPVLSKMLGQLSSQLSGALHPVGLDEGLQALKSTVRDPVLRESLFRISRNDTTLNLKSHIKPLAPVVFKHGTPEDPCALSDVFAKLLRLFKVEPAPGEAFNLSATTLVDNHHPSPSAGGVVPRGRRNDSFLRCEDALLLVGLKKFGLGNWEMIQAAFLPTRTTRQLQVRFKNLVSRRAPTNPVKAFVDMLWRPLSRAEEELIYRGVQVYGRDFKQISSHFLPHRPPTILKNLWDRLDEMRRRSVGEGKVHSVPTK